MLWTIPPKLGKIPPKLRKIPPKLGKIPPKLGKIPPKRRNIPSSAAYWSLSRASRPCRRERSPIASIRTSTRSNTVYGGSKKRAFSLISVPHKRVNGYALRPHNETAAEGHSSFSGGFLSFYAVCTNRSQISAYAASTSQTYVRASVSGACARIVRRFVRREARVSGADASVAAICT